jgi:pimeloyl-ACP methyl ester carboxylesterase
MGERTLIAGGKLVLVTQRRDGIRYYDSGLTAISEKPAVLLLHGIGGSLNFWHAVISQLTPFVRTIAVDLPGFGQSAAIERMTLTSVSDRIVALLDDLNVQSTVIVAHSMGGIVGLAMAGRHDCRAKRLVLVSATLLSALDLLQQPHKVVTRPRLAVLVAAQLIGGLLPLRRHTARAILAFGPMRSIALWPYVAHPRPLDPDILADALSRNGGIGMFKALREVRQTNLDGLMKAVRVPVDVVWGAKDLLIPPADVTRACEVLPVCRVRQIDNCGHWPLIETPQILGALIRDDDGIDAAGQT